MTRLINQAVDVTTGPHGAPVEFRTRGGSRHRVHEVLDCWSEAGRWWEREGEQITYRVITTTGGIHELTWDPAHKRWILYKSYD